MNYARLLVNILSLLFLLVISGCADIASKTDYAPEVVCSPKSASSATTLEDMRQVTSFCVQHPETYGIALDKLNAMPMPLPPHINLRKQIHTAQTERKVFDMSIYFNVFDSFPVDSAFKKLNELITTINNSTSTKIDVIILNGGIDLNEGSLKACDSLGISRANAIRRYLTTAGIDKSRIYPIQERKPNYNNTIEGRSRDRVVEITVVTLSE